jgi:hypothetical protein
MTASLWRIGGTAVEAIRLITCVLDRYVVRGVVKNFNVMCFWSSTPNTRDIARARAESRGRRARLF